MQPHELAIVILNAQRNAQQLLAAQREHAAIQARSLARVDAEIAKRAQQDRARKD